MRRDKMGNYNSQYESYYSSIVNKRANSGYSRGSGEKKPKGNWIVRRLMQELCGVLVMLIFVIFCKFVVTPQTAAAYNYSKTIINSNYDYKNIISKAKNIDTSKNFQDRAVEFIDNLKSRFTGGQTIKEKIKEKFSLPANGNIINQEDDGISIQTTEDGKIIASFDGRVKECGADNELGNYILIDHGEGIETMYSNLEDIIVNQDDEVKKGELIARSKVTQPRSYVRFQVLFMGQSKGLESIVGFKS
jgi:murein DD-endopeptidase MepM/ murein hydrolase activator NlpD